MGRGRASQARTPRSDTTPQVLRLGRGGLGTAYRLAGHDGSRPMVVKLMPEGGMRARLSARLSREMSTIAALSQHDDCVAITSYGSRDDRWYVAMEEAPAGSLAGLVDAGATLDWRSAVRLGVRMARVVELAHGLGVLHRDIKPANILLGVNGAPRLTDMGLGTLACSFSLDTAAAAQSLACAAPEAARTMALTPQADVFALAATLRLLVGGRSAAGGMRPLSPSLLDVLDEATAADPRDRHPSMTSLREDLELLDDRRRRRLRIEIPTPALAS